MEQVVITRKPPHYMPEISGELIFGISGNDCLFHYLSEIFGNLICHSFDARSNFGSECRSHFAPLIRDRNRGIKAY